MNTEFELNKITMNGVLLESKKFAGNNDVERLSNFLSEKFTNWKSLNGDPGVELEKRKIEKEIMLAKELHTILFVKMKEEQNNIKNPFRFILLPGKN